jgi:hypothetical protein
MVRFPFFIGYRTYSQFVHVVAFGVSVHTTSTLVGSKRRREFVTLGIRERLDKQRREDFVVRGRSV